MITESLILIYFSLLIWSAITVWNSWNWKASLFPDDRRQKHDGRCSSSTPTPSRPDRNLPQILIIISLLAFLVTWYFIAVYMYDEIYRFATWEEFKSRDGSLFFGAYRAVVDTKARWFYSSSLLSYVLISTPYIILEGAKMGLTRSQTFAYVVLGFLGAVSVSHALFFAHSLERIRSNKEVEEEEEEECNNGIINKRVSGMLVTCALLAMHSIVMLERTHLPATRGEFEIHLLVVHFILLLPTLWGLPSCSSAPSTLDDDGARRRGWNAYRLLVASVAVPSHVHTFISVLSQNNGFRVLFTDFLENPCSISITVDVIVSTLITALYVRERRRLSLKGHYERTKKMMKNTAAPFEITRLSNKGRGVPPAFTLASEGPSEAARFVGGFMFASFLVSPAAVAGWGLLGGL